MVDMKEDKVFKVHYQCPECNETDAMEVFPDEQIPQVINCWNCHYGYGKAGVGMAMVRPTALAENSPQTS